MPAVNFNYVLGFTIVMSLLYISIILLTSPWGGGYQITAENDMPMVGITIITDRSPLKLDQHMLNHYLNRLKENLEYLSNRVDPEKCESIKSQLQSARQALSDQIEKHSDQKEDIQKERKRLRQRINAVSDIMFSNDQNPDDARSVIFEMILDLETLMYLTKMIPMEMDSIDVRDVDRITKLIYEKACYPKIDALSTPDMTHFDDEPEKPFEDAFLSEQKHRPGSFETFVDFNKHQNLTESRRSTSTYNPSLKTRKKNLGNLRKTSLDSASIRMEKHGENKLRKHKVFKESDGTDPIRDRVLQAREAFIAEHPDRYLRKKSSLISDYDPMEDSTIMPALAFASYD